MHEQLHKLELLLFRWHGVTIPPASVVVCRGGGGKRIFAMFPLCLHTKYSVRKFGGCEGAQMHNCSVSTALSVPHHYDGIALKWGGGLLSHNSVVVFSVAPPPPFPVLWYGGQMLSIFTRQVLRDSCGHLSKTREHFHVGSYKRHNTENTENTEYHSCTIHVP